jgi:hypothetical protein
MRYGLLFFSIAAALLAGPGAARAWDPPPELEAPGSPRPHDPSQWMDLTTNPWLRGGGDGGSPWPTVLIPPDDPEPLSARIGEVSLFTWPAWNGNDHDVRLVRLDAGGGATIHQIGSGPGDDLRPRLTGSSDGPVLLVWHRVRRDGFDLLAAPLRPDGSPGGEPLRLARFDLAVRDATALWLPRGELLVAWARRTGDETVIVAMLGDRPPLVLGTAPGDVPLALSIGLDQNGAPRVRWEWDEQTTASVEGDRDGRWRSPRYARRPGR